MKQLLNLLGTVRPERRRKPQGGAQRLTPVELALLDSCGERIRATDWAELRRAGFIPRRTVRWLLGGTAFAASTARVRGPKSSGGS